VVNISKNGGVIINTTDNLELAIELWNNKLTEIWSLLTQSPVTFKGGSIWNIIVGINGALEAIGIALLVLFFLSGVVKQTTNFHEIKRPEVALRLFIRFAIAKGMVTWGMDIMVGLFNIGQGIITKVAGSLGSANQAVLPAEVTSAVSNLVLFEKFTPWVLSLIALLVITVMSFIMLLTVYSRFFKLYMYTALAPIPLSTFAGEGTQSVGVSFLKAYAGVCLEGAVIILACVIFSAFASSPPSIDASLPPTKIVFNYMGTLIFNLFVLVGMVKSADRLCKEMMGL